MEKRRFDLIFALAAVCGLVLASMVAAQPTLRLGAASNTGGMVVFVGVDKSIFAKHGIDAKVMVRNTGPQLTKSLKAGEIDFVPAAFTNLPAALERGLKMRGVMGYVGGPARRTDRLNTALAQKPSTVNLLVTSKFPPEEFHVRLYQQVGSMRGVEGNTAKLYRVSPHHVRALSRYYWIKQIDLAPETK
ncbi:MAG: hypothetical protein ETSY2_20030 [Candidatus Entotheonella gemina]|uniref:SsuA/THI5-like domain-containing protein n=1 Tax=Candidatus Entotheonella gemina TaxID=1429439 RepID=W4M7Q2_9BACT|nr:MAG: hypothetical protein ETSY2_20030 [Candidatus Entotheonella gemina]